MIALRQTISRADPSGGRATMDLSSDSHGCGLVAPLGWPTGQPVRSGKERWASRTSDADDRKQSPPHIARGENGSAERVFGVPGAQMVVLQFREEPATRRRLWVAALCRRATSRI